MYAYLAGMLSTLRRLWGSFAWLLAAMPVVAEVHVEKEAQMPNRIDAWVVAGDWADHLPPAERVNAPAFLQKLYPKQTIAVALVAQGPDRKTLLNGITASVQFSSRSHGATVTDKLQPSASRQLKAQGADFVLLALKAAGISGAELAKTEQSIAVYSGAVVVPKWTVPDVKASEDLEISVTIYRGPNVEQVAPRVVKIRSAAEWLADPPPAKEEMGNLMTRHHEPLSPFALLTWLRAAAESGDLSKSAVNSFFALRFQSDATAIESAVELYPQLEPATQKALLFVLRLGGQNVGELFPHADPELLASMAKLSPIKDPRALPHFKDPVDLELVKNLGNIMDQCWAGWMATGDPSYLRPLVGLLEGASDYPKLQQWTNARTGAKGMNAKVARGLAYQIAGWSIGSFQRTDPRVMDWLLYWQDDPTMPAVLRKEIPGLLTNPAFKRN